MNVATTHWESARHKTAMHRKSMSKPIRLALQHGLITPDTHVMDFGCGHGEDVRQLREMGVFAEGWDPVFAAHGLRRSSQVVNLGYVLNVIESVEERSQVLKESWALAEGLLIVSVRSTVDDGPENGTSLFGDGFVTRLGSFQKFYDQSELRLWIQEVLAVDPLAIAPGIFLVFRDEGLREAWRAQQFRRNVGLPRISSRARLFQDHREILEPLMAFFTERGRLPHEDELKESPDLAKNFGTLPKAFQVVRSVTGIDPWLEIQMSRKSDLMVWLALSRFRMRPQLSTLPLFLQRDIRALFSSYTRACEEADSQLMSIGNPEVRDEAMLRAPFGKLMPKGLYVHADHLDELPPVLRLYEGCARAFVGGVPEANLIKFHRDAAQVSYLTYQDFQKIPHPELLESVVVSLDGRKIRRRDYRGQINRFLLHRKETFIPQGSELWMKFHRLTEQEERWGLFAQPSEIGTRAGWERTLTQQGCRLHGHRLVRSKEPNLDS